MKTTAHAAAMPAAERINGIDMVALGEVRQQIERDPGKAKVGFQVTSRWQGQTRSEATVSGYTLGGQQVPRSFKIAVDEPLELLGENTAPNPQELLMTALNACVMVGYVAGATAKGITLEQLEVECTGELDLRGFLGMDDSVPPGYPSLHYTVRMKGNGTPEQFREIHETVKRTSPNFFNISQPVRIDTELQIL